MAGVTSDSTIASAGTARPTDERRARLRALGVAVLVGGWIAIQVAVPTWRLIERGDAPRPRTHGWQMFSHELPLPAERFYVTTTDGERREYPAFTLLDGPMRREVVFAPAIVAELCSRPDIVLVEVHDVELGDSAVRCR